MNKKFWRNFFVDALNMFIKYSLLTLLQGIIAEFNKNVNNKTIRICFKMFGKLIVNVFCTVLSFAMT